MSAVADDNKCHCESCQAFWNGEAPGKLHTAKLHSTMVRLGETPIPEPLEVPKRKSKIAAKWDQHSEALALNAFRTLIGALVIALSGGVLFFGGWGLILLVQTVGWKLFLIVPAVLLCWLIGRLFVKKEDW